MPCSSDVPETNFYFEHHTDFFKSYHIWAWRPSWSCDPDQANKPSKLHTKFGFDWGSGFGDVLNIVDDERKSIGYTISSSGEHAAQLS